MAGGEFWTEVNVKVKFMFKDPSSIESPLNRPPHNEAWNPTRVRGQGGRPQAAIAAPGRRRWALDGRVTEPMTWCRAGVRVWLGEN